MLRELDTSDGNNNINYNWYANTINLDSAHSIETGDYSVKYINGELKRNIGGITSEKI